MNTEKWHAARFCKFAGACAIFYIAAQSFQEVVFRMLKAGDPLQSIATRATPLDQLHALLILLGIFLCIPLFGALTLRLYSRSPISAALGFTFGFFFVICEVLYRSVDLFVASRQWAAQYMAAESQAVRAVLAVRIQTWDEVVSGWYFGLLLAVLATSVSFAIAAWSRQDRKDQWLSFVFQFDALRTLIRLAGEFGGIDSLMRITYAIYFPGVLITFGYFAFWLFSQAAKIKSSEQKLAD